MKIKKMVFLVTVFSVVSMVSISCAKQCNCIRYEDGNKIAVITDESVKYFELSVCEAQSVEAHQGTSWVVDGKEVTVEIKCK